MGTSNIQTLQVVTTPTLDWLSEKASNCRSRALIASPYVNDGITELTSLIPTGVARTLITCTDLREFAMGSSDLETLCILARDGVRVRSLTGLHAKMYIFDEASALVTSANATYSGMRRNWECGLGTSDIKVVRQLARSLSRGLGADAPPRDMKTGDLEALRAPLAVIKATMPEPPARPKRAENSPVPDAVFSVTDEAALLAGFKGWSRLTLKGVLAMPKEGFRSDALLRVCTPLAAKQYPKNYHVPDKLRQQLQILRDLRIVEFVSRGVYRRTMEIDKKDVIFSHEADFTS